MENPGCPRRRRPARLLGWMLGTAALTCLAQPAAIRPHWKVEYPPEPNGRTAVSAAVPLDEDSLLVSVVQPGANAGSPALHLGKQKFPVEVLGYDPVSSLSFLKVDGGVKPEPMRWLDRADGVIGGNLRALTQSGPLPCRAAGWVKQVGTKILPLALLQITFDQAAPPPGTPLVDAQGRVAGVIFQAAAGGNAAYAIPAEAVHRVRRNLGNGGHLQRGWLGLSLRAETKVPQVVKVLPNSPAATAGIRPADVLVKVGSRSVADYADAVNAFFYLIPGQPVPVKLRRGANQLEFTLTPARPPAK
jgi:hypothetical protein